MLSYTLAMTWTQWGFMLVPISGWMHRQEEVTDYLGEETGWAGC